MFSLEVGYTLESALREARTRRNAFFTPEHILYALLYNPTVKDVVENCGGDVSTIRQNLEDYFEKQVDKIPAGQIETDPLKTPGVEIVLEYALRHLQSAGKREMSTADLLVAIYALQDSFAVYYLEQEGVDRLSVLEYISHGLPKVPMEKPEDGLVADRPLKSDGEKKTNKKQSPLELFAEDVTEQAAKGQLDPIIGREKEIDRALKILCRRQKNNPLLLGDPGVGKTALVNGIAQRIVDGAVPERLKGSKVFSLNMGAMVAGTKYRGEFEERIKMVVAELQKIEKAILFIDEIHTVVGAGAVGSGSMDAANLLKPALSSGKMRCIGATTHEDYKKHFEKDRALNRRFSRIDLNEPSQEDCLKILKGLKGNFEKHHNVKYTEAALKAAVELSAKYINERFLPDKAIDVIDEAAAANALLPKGKRKKQLTETEIELAVSAIAQVPVVSVSFSDESKIKNLEAELKKVIFGQDKAVEALAFAVKRGRANLNRNNKPVGSFLFAGPTGVGKTELALQLSKLLGVEFHRFDMSEYMEKHTVSRLVGAPPGYVGHDDGGQLTDLVRKHPHAVLLLDEIEKAHPDIFNILLQIMDNASLTDSQGRKADFRNVTLIMTTNAGSDKAITLGFGKSDSSDHSEKAIKQLFRPEFRNRLDDIIYFAGLSRPMMVKILEKFVKELSEQLKEREIEISLDAKAKEWLVEHGFDDKLGARPLARLIQREIKDKFVDEILFGSLKKGGQIKVGVKNDKLALDISKN